MRGGAVWPGLGLGFVGFARGRRESAGRLLRGCGANQGSPLLTAVGTPSPAGLSTTCSSSDPMVGVVLDVPLPARRRRLSSGAPARDGPRRGARSRAPAAGAIYVLG